MLHVWELAGAPDTWEKQLSERLALEPVYAILSGLGGSNWAPIHHFCEREAIPCLLPNVDLPVVAEGDFYPVYFSKGVVLEAQLAAHWLPRQFQRHNLQRIVQFYRLDDVGAQAADAVRASLSAAGIAVVDRPLAPGADRAAWLRAADEVGGDDGLLLWMRPDDLKELSETAPKAGAVLISGLMAGLAAEPLPAAWRETIRMTYPLDLAARSALRMATLRAWFDKNKVPIVDERVQFDTYVACAAMSEIWAAVRDLLTRAAGRTLRGHDDDQHHARPLSEAWPGAGTAVCLQGWLYRSFRDAEAKEPTPMGLIVP